MKESYMKGIAESRLWRDRARDSCPGPEPCADIREDTREALTGGNVVPRNAGSEITSTGVLTLCDDSPQAQRLIRMKDNKSYWFCFWSSRYNSFTILKTVHNSFTILKTVI